MARLIDADALHKKFFKEFDHNCRLVNKQNVARAWQGAMQLLYDAPTIEAEPVKHGKWKAVPNRILIGGRVATQGTAWECSACNNSSKQYLPTMKFCPNCGARMDGE